MLNNRPFENLFEKRLQSITRQLFRAKFKDSVIKDTTLIVHQIPNPINPSDPGDLIDISFYRITTLDSNTVWEIPVFGYSSLESGNQILNLNYLYLGYTIPVFKGFYRTFSSQAAISFDEMVTALSASDLQFIKQLAYQNYCHNAERKYYDSWQRHLAYQLIEYRYFSIVRSAINNFLTDYEAGKVHLILDGRVIPYSTYYNQFMMDTMSSDGGLVDIIFSADAILGWDNRKGEIVPCLIVGNTRLYFDRSKENASAQKLISLAREWQPISD